MTVIEKRLRTGSEGGVVAPNFEYFLENLSQLHLTPSILQFCIDTVVFSMSYAIK